MNVSEKNGLKLTHQGKVYYFCSKHCVEKFAKEHGVSQEHVASCAVKPKTPFYRNKTFIVAVILGSLVLVSYVLPILEPFRKALLDYLKIIWWAILLGLFIGGLIDHYVPREYATVILARGGKRAILNSVVLGFFMSACSHGILALSIQLHKKGASNPSVVSFLLASPWANMALTIMLIGFFGFKGLYIIFSAIVIAIITGFIFQFLDKKGLIEKNQNTISVDKEFSIKEDIKKRFKQYKFSLEAIKSDVKGIYVGAVSLSNMVLWWILIGMGIASFAGAYIPTDFFQNYMGATILGLFVTLAIATVIEVCSEGSAPMAFEIFKQTGALGNAFVFLMAGVATDYTEIGLLWHNVGKKTAIWLPIVTVPQVIILGWIANIIF
jgi:uncharacterized membrane protein YraQ (UPF0718 family)/YHS domain-containing protein